MSKNFKKSLSLAVLICILMVTFSSAKTYANEITPRYNNVLSASLTTSVNDNGTLIINYNYNGFPDITTKAVITTYVEKKTLLFFWTRVDIGQPNNEWIQTINDYEYSDDRIYSLPSTGTYRTTVIYKIYGSGGAADTITRQHETTY
ncbi:MAG: hypothetical protein IJE49_12725 [Agathobacter sp.]|nr:hypothetical protein [Agathobacter sp.]MBQ2902690.1 hypothetical protein [Agathobacter sp.]